METLILIYFCFISLPSDICYSLRSFKRSLKIHTKKKGSSVWKLKEQLKDILTSRSSFLLGVYSVAF